MAKFERHGKKPEKVVKKEKVAIPSDPPSSTSSSDSDTEAFTPPDPHKHKGSS
jgi:hypothetical protein